MLDEGDTIMKDGEKWFWYQKTSERQLTGCNFRDQGNGKINQKGFKQLTSYNNNGKWWRLCDKNWFYLNFNAHIN